MCREAGGELASIVVEGIELSTLAGRRRRSTVVDESSPLAGVNLPEAARDFSQKLQNYTISLASTVSKAIPVAELAARSDSLPERLAGEAVLLLHRLRHLRIGSNAWPGGLFWSCGASQA